MKRFWFLFGVLLVAFASPTEAQKSGGARSLERRGTLEIPRSDGYVKVDSSISLYYRIVGQGPDTVMVLHGGPGMHMNT